MGRPREHGTATQTALLDVAGEILGAEGVEAVTIRRVADAAGTTTRAVYTLFGDKNGLLRALFRQMAEVMRRNHEAVGDLADPIEEIQLLAAAYRAGARQHPNLYDHYYRSIAPGTTTTAEDAALAYQTFERVLRTLHRLADDGHLGGRDVESTGLQLWALVHGLASLEIRGLLCTSEESGRRRWRSAVAALLAGLQAPEPPGESSAVTRHLPV